MRLFRRNLGNDELAGRDHRFVLFDFRQNVRREVGVLVGDADALVLHGEDEALAAGELAVKGHLANVIRGHIDALHHRGEDCRLAAAVDAIGILILVDADRPADITLLGALFGFLDEAIARATSGMENDIGAGIVLLLRKSLTFIRSREIAGIVYEDLAIRIDCLYALLETSLEFFNERKLHAADKANDVLPVGLRLESRRDTNEEGAFVLGEAGRGDVREVHDGVDDEELTGRIVGRDLRHCLLKEESRSDDEAQSFIRKGRKVRDIICFRAGLQILVIAFRELEILREADNAFPRALVEGLVVNTTNVGDETDSELCKHRRRDECSDDKH